jgi:hypothetical protein
LGSSGFSQQGHRIVGDDLRHVRSFQHLIVAGGNFLSRQGFGGWRRRSRDVGEGWRRWWWRAVAGSRWWGWRTAGEYLNVHLGLHRRQSRGRQRTDGLLCLRPGRFRGSGVVGVAFYPPGHPRGFYFGQVDPAGGVGEGFLVLFHHGVLHAWWRIHSSVRYL